MRNFLVLCTMWIIMLSACYHEHGHDPNQSDTHEAKLKESNPNDHDHAEMRSQLTAYSDNFELFAEYDPFISQKPSKVLAHFSWIESFKPVADALLIITLDAGDQPVADTASMALREGIYAFELTPGSPGKARLIFTIASKGVQDTMILEDIHVYTSMEETHLGEGPGKAPLNAIVFTKEQSWKLDFKTEAPVRRPFGKVIKAVGQVQIPNCEEVILTAKTSGIINFAGEHLISGKKLNKNQVLFNISSGDFIDGNLNIRFSMTMNDLENARSEFERFDSLYREKLVKKQDYMSAKSDYQKAQIELDNLNRNYKSGGQQIKSPMNGFIKDLFIQNGQYVEAGNSIASIINNRKILIKTDLSLQDAAKIPLISSIIIKDYQNNSTREFTDLGPEILTIGQHTNVDNFLVPVSIELDNLSNNIPGSFIEMNIKTVSNKNALTIPNGALMEEQGKLFVFVQITPELIEKRYVNIGNSDGINTEITAGLDVNERIVSEGAIFIKLAQSTGHLDAHSGHVH